MHVPLGVRITHLAFNPDAAVGCLDHAHVIPSVTWGAREHQSATAAPCTSLFPKGSAKLQLGQATSGAMSPTWGFQGVAGAQVPGSEE